MSIIDEIYSLGDNQVELPSITMGRVVNVNDPQQMGRVQVFMPSMGHNGTIHDHTTDEGQHYYWVSYASPLAGSDTTQVRGPNEGETTEGVMSYGMWAIPSVGANVLVAIVDDDPRQMYWFACIHNYGTPHTLPHGRYLGDDSGVDGPFVSNETNLTPLYKNLKKAFGEDTAAPEWISRGADYSASAVSQRQVSYKNFPVSSSVPDNFESDVTEADGQKTGRDQKYTQGYAVNRADPDKDTNTEDLSRKGNETPKNMESTVKSFTSQGGHAWAMDDRSENNRMRLRTSTGHQIILDDTNERIYISTNEGRNYIEMDSDGHVYVYTQESFSVRSEGDINFTTEKTFRVKAKEGIHHQTEDEYRVHAKKDIHTHGELNSYTKIDGNRHDHIVGTDNLLVDDEIHIHGKKNIFTLTDKDFHLRSDNVRVKSSNVIASESGSTTTVSATNVNIDASGNIDHTGSLDTAKSTTVGTTLTAGTAVTAATVTGGSMVTSGGIDLDKLSGEYKKHKHICAKPGDPSGPADKTSDSGSKASDVSVVKSSPPDPGVVKANDSEDAENAYWTNITPKHEPWHRTFNGKKGEAELFNHKPEYEPTSPKVARDNKQNPSNDHERGKLWHR